MNFALRERETAPHCLLYIGVSGIHSMACAPLVVWVRVITNGEHRYGQSTTKGNKNIH